MTQPQPFAYVQCWQVMLPNPPDDAETPAPDFEVYTDFERANRAVLDGIREGKLPKGTWLKGGMIPVYRPEDISIEGFGES